MTTTKASTGPVSVNVHILGKEYQIQCPPNEKHQLIRAAEDVNNRMRAAKGVGTNITTEKAAVLSALNLANELQGSTDNTDMLESVSDSIIDMKARIDKALNTKVENSGLESDQAANTDGKVQARLL